MDEQQQIPTKGTGAYLDYVSMLAKGPTLEEGIVNEPRLYFDRVTQNADMTVQTNGTPDALYNRELFPVRLTHLTAAVGWGFTPGNAALLVQNIGLQLRYHDQFYMNQNPVTVAAWANKVVAAPDVNSGAMSAWDFVASGSRPPVLAKQDTFQVEVRCDDPDNSYISVQNPLPVTVTFTGFGLLSKRPYLFSGTQQLTAFGTRVAIPASNYRNDGNEPIIITDMTVLVGGQTLSSEAGPTFLPGDIRRISLNIKQVGSGTGSWWFAGPPIDPMCPAALLGITTGRAIVHQFPGIGQQFNPADGMTLTVQRVGNPQLELAIPANIGLVGYIMVT